MWSCLSSPSCLSATLHVLFTVGSKHVVELGSGLGLVGISSLLLFPLASFTFTDCHPWVLEALRENLQLQSVCTLALRYSQLSSIVSVPAVHIWCQIHEPLHYTCSVYTLQCYSQCFYGDLFPITCYGVLSELVCFGACSLSLATSWVLLWRSGTVCVLSPVHPAVTWWWYSCVNEGEQFKCSNYSVEELDWLSCSDKETHPVLSQNFDLILASGKKCLLIYYIIIQSP